MLGAVNEYERAMIALRLRSGRRRKADKGADAYGSPPYGYRVQAGALVPDELEQVAIARMRGLRASGASLRQIATLLEGEGCKPKRGERWYPMTSRQILSR